MPEEFHGLILDSPSFVLPIDSADEQSVEAVFSHQVGVFFRMAEGIDLPADAGPTALAKSIDEFPAKHFYI